MRLVLIVAVVALTGCQTMEQLRATAPQQSDYEICRASTYGGPALVQVAWEERTRRGLNCEPYMASIQMNHQARQQQAAQEAASGLQLLQMSRPQPMMGPPMFPQPISCSSRNVMGTIYTDCR